MKLLEIAEVANFLLVKAHGGALPVLIVDDDKTLCKLIAIWLADLGIKSEQHHNLESARAALLERNFGLVFLDIHLSSGESGLVLWEEIQRNGERHNIPVVFITGMEIWVSTVKGPKKFRDSEPRPLPGPFCMFIPKGSSGFELGIQRAVKLLGMSQKEARRIFAVRIVQSVALVAIGFGLCDGLWFRLVVSIGKLFK